MLNDRNDYSGISNLEELALRKSILRRQIRGMEASMQSEVAQIRNSFRLTSLLGNVFSFSRPAFRFATMGFNLISSIIRRRNRRRNRRKF